MPLPCAGVPQIVDRLLESVDAVLELPQPAVAVEAQDATDLTRHMIVVDMLRNRFTADGTEATLAQSHLIHISLGDPVSALKVPIARGAVILVPIQLNHCVVAGFAVAGQPVT